MPTCAFFFLVWAQMIDLDSFSLSSWWRVRPTVSNRRPGFHFLFEERSICRSSAKGWIALLLKRKWKRKVTVDGKFFEKNRSFDRPSTLSFSFLFSKRKRKWMDSSWLSRRIHFSFNNFYFLEENKKEIVNKKEKLHSLEPGIRNPSIRSLISFLLPCRT